MPKKLTLTLSLGLSLSMASPLPAAPAAAPQPATKTPAQPTLSQHVEARIKSALDQLESDQDFRAARESLTALFDQVLLHAPTTDLRPWRDAAFALRLVTQLEKAPEEARPALLKYLRANDALARSLVMLVRHRDKPTDAYALLDRLRRERGEALDKYATLAAAICVVHDRPLEARINENKATAPDPVAIFDYFSKNEGRMLFGIRPVPPELLIYVVDTTASIDEMTWANAKYAGNARVGALFFNIKYDYEHYRRGTPKKITELGFHLPNILQYGGICADQAYFAVSVGKSIGVPTAYTWGASGDSAHAWVGFLEAQGRTGRWNFDIGRYKAYRGVRGNVRDPQTRELIPDAYVSLLAELIGTRPEDRYAATALTDAAARLAQLRTLEQPAPPPFENVTMPAASSNARRSIPAAQPPAPLQPRATDVPTQLDLLELAIRQCPAARDAWFAAGGLAEEGHLSLDQKRRWADLLTKVAGAKYPDFAWAVLKPMVKTIEDPKEQNKIWNAAFALFQQRADLAAEVRMAQAEMWQSHDQPDLAGQCYMDVIERFTNAGPFVLTALKEAEKTLRRTNRSERIPLLYQQTWARAERPDPKADVFATQSNWYRVGHAYAEVLKELGHADQADAVMAQLQSNFTGTGR